MVSRHQSRQLKILMSVLATSLVVIFPSSGKAQGPDLPALPPSAALEWRSPELAALLQEASLLEAESVSGQRPGFEARVDPLIRFRDYPRDGDAGEWSERLGISASIDFGEPADGIARLRQGLEQARRRVFLAELDGVSSALLAHGNLLVAQLDAREASAELTEARADLSAALQEPVAAAAVEVFRFEVREAELEHREALQELQEARSEARAHGLEGEAVYERLRFVLPTGSVQPRRMHEYRMLELELLEARAELVAARRGNLDDLRLRTGYRTRSAAVDLEGGLLNGAPGVLIGIDMPGGVERWEVEVSAQIVLADDSREVERLGMAVEQVQAELEAFPERFQEELGRALTWAQLTEEGLDLAERELELRGESARDDLHRAWLAYLRSVADVLELTGEAWTVRAE